MIRISVVVLAFGDQPHLESCIDAILGSQGAEIELIVVDNGSEGMARKKTEGKPVLFVEPGRNLGFAGGCNFGAQHATGDVLALVNGDAEVDPRCLLALAGSVADNTVGIATASVRLADRPDRLNSGGNVVHFLGFGWSDHFGKPADSVAKGDVAVASGACMAIRTELWNQLGGFTQEYFAYHEDAELSMRVRQQRLRVEYVPEAIAYHHYEFSRNPMKFYLLERNRWIYLLTLLEARTLLLLLPACIVAEVGLVFVALKEGWWREKLRSWTWLASNGRWISGKRHELQRWRKCPDRDLVPWFASRFDPTYMVVSGPVRVADRCLSVYWGLVKRWV